MVRRPCEVAESYRLRVTGAYDNSEADAIRIIAVGAGGDASLLKNLGRVGIGEVVFIDPDIVEAPNIGSQQATPSSIGDSKVSAIAREYRALNPMGAALAIQMPIEQISDAEFESLVRRPLRGDPTSVARCTPGSRDLPIGRTPSRIVLLGLTDDFYAQARVHRLGLHFGWPTLCAQEYREGRGAEITYTFPGVTPACHRCVTSSRYDAYLSHRYVNTVTSDGAPIFAAELLNAVIGHVLLAMIHHGSSHPRWGNALQRLGNRNLILLRMDPDIGTTLGVKTFDRVFSGVDHENLFMCDSVFLPQRPDCPANGHPRCPDCGGTGDLRDSIGTFEDTRIMRLPDQALEKT